MKLYAQHGYGDGEKTTTGLAQALIDGVIFSPKDISLDSLNTSIEGIRGARRRADILFDPQFYACFAAVDPAASVGRLVEDYSDYFAPRRRSQLLSERQLMEDMDNVLQFQQRLGVTAMIAPNVIIPRSFDSAESAISMDFIRNTRGCCDELRERRKVYATLAVGRDAVIDKEELYRFLTDLTALEERPDGFYVLMAVNSSEARAEVYHADVIAGWMLINHVLSLNGYEVINGYSDILTPFFGAAGGVAGATGWWANLRNFSLDRFAAPLRGGRLPIERYLSCALLNRITYSELEALREAVPEVLNGLPNDALYPAGTSQPPRNQEVLQSWEAIHALNQRLLAGDLTESLGVCQSTVDAARRVYDHAQARQQFDPKSNDQHLDPIQEGIQLFARFAELELP